MGGETKEISKNLEYKNEKEKERKGGEKELERERKLKRINTGVASSE